MVNGSAYDVFGARALGRFYDGAGALLATAETRSGLGKLEIERFAPFRMIADVDPEKVASYELAVAFDDASIIEFRHPDVSETSVVDRDGRLLVVGALHNGHGRALTHVVVVAVLYDEDGEVTDVVEASLSGEVILPGADLPFAIPLDEPVREFRRVRILAQGQLSLL